MGQRAGHLGVQRGWGAALRFQGVSRRQVLPGLPISGEGNPSDQPAAAAERTSENELEVYASWNGATEIESWEVLAGPHPGRLESVGSVPRDGFETAMLVKTSEPYVAVQAKHRSGRVLGSSTPVEA